MSLSIGIVGLPNVGKSTLFTALTNKGGLAANYPLDRKSTRLNSSHIQKSRMPSSA